MKISHRILNTVYPQDVNLLSVGFYKSLKQIVFWTHYKGMHPTKEYNDDEMIIGQWHIKPKKLDFESTQGHIIDGKMHMLNCSCEECKKINKNL